MGNKVICCDGGDSEAMPSKDSYILKNRPIIATTIVRNRQAVIDSTEETTEREEEVNENMFEKLHIIGKGGFSIVYLVRYIETGLICAMKIMNKERLIEAEPEIDQKGEPIAFKGIKTER